jgi:hypothetical protein
VRIISSFALLLSMTLCAFAQLASTEPALYSGTCSPSSAVAIGGDLFAVGDDDGRQLRIYHRSREGKPLHSFDLTGPLELDHKGSKTDIEGAARLGDLFYWISSHGRSSTGVEHSNRYRFFATEFQSRGSSVRMAIVGKPYQDLLRDLTTSPGLASLNLAGASRLPAKAEGGLNIEGLSATPENHLLIGFRSPVPEGKALIVPLLNPQELGLGPSAKFGPPIGLDLGGLGIRDMVFWEGIYLIVAGPSQGGGKSRLYSWSGGDSKPKRLKEINLKGLNPEALVIYTDRGFGDVQLLSDDSSRKVGGVECGDLKPSARQFRSIRAALELE